MKERGGQKSLTSLTLILQWWFLVGELSFLGVLRGSLGRYTSVGLPHLQRPPHGDDTSPQPGTPTLSLRPRFFTAGFLWFCRTDSVSQPEILQISVVGMGHPPSDSRGHRFMASRSPVYQEREKHPHFPFMRGKSRTQSIDLSKEILDLIFSFFWGLSTSLQTRSRCSDSL